jgi:hypothetical protein
LAFLFAFPKPGVIFCIFLHFLDRVCHLHRLPDPYEKTTRKWTMLESRKRQENDKKMTRKWQKKWLNKWQKNDKKWHHKTGMTKTCKTKWQKHDKKWHI